MSHNPYQDLFIQADTLRNNGQTQSAIATYHRIMSQAQDNQDQAHMAQATYYIGSCYRLENNQQQATIFLERAAEWFRHLQNPTGEGNAYRETGLLHHQNKQYEEALRQLQKAATILRTQDNQIDHALALSQSALVMRKLHQWDKASALFKQALGLIREHGDLLAEAQVLIDWTQLAHKKRDYHQMITKSWAAYGLLHHTQTVNHHKLLLTEIYGLLAYAYVYIGNLELAQPFFHQALDFIKKMSPEIQQSVLTFMKAKRYLKYMKKHHTSLFNQLAQDPLLSSTIAKLK